MTTFALRFRAAAFFISGCALTACGGGGTGASSAPILPAAAIMPQAGTGPVAFMQNSGPLTSSGTIVKGASSAIVAVMSGAMQTGSQFSADTLTVSAGGTQTAVRAARMPVVLEPAHGHAPEAFAADDSALLEKLRAQGSSSVQAPGATRSSAASVVRANALPGAKSSIWVQQGGYASRASVQVPATLLAQSAHGNIWVQSTLVSSLSADVPQLTAAFENAYASDTAHFASPDYGSNAPGMQPQYASCSASGSHQGTAPAYIAEPADRRINVMIVDSSALGGLGGYFSAANLMTQGALNCLNAGYESNEAPFIFVGWFSSYGASYELQEDLVRSTAHELQHLINFVNHAILAPGASSASFNGTEAQYINEGLSMLAQDFAVSQMYAGKGLPFDVADALQRAQAYLNDPSSYSISAFSGIDPSGWGGNASTAQVNCSGGCYGGAYLFARYLRDRFGDQFTHEMESSGATGAANLQAVTGENYGQLFGDFALAMAAGTLGVASSDARFSFGTLNLKGTYADQFSHSLTLSGINAAPYTGGTATVRAPVGGFAFMQIPSVPSSGMSVQVTDQAAVAGFALLGGLASR
ncbi:MAG: hypothetical protein ABR508_01375 [Candidatus Baltobacteraceae bacterium]